MLLRHAEARASPREDCRAGRIRAASVAMIAMQTSNSTCVNPPRAHARLHFGRISALRDEPYGFSIRGPLSTLTAATRNRWPNLEESAAPGERRRRLARLQSHSKITLSR